MKLDEIKYSLQNLRKRKLRSFLTVLSIMIGITSIFALVSFGEGIRYYVDNIAAEAGKDKLYIQAEGIGAPGTDENFFISKDDVDFVEKIKGVNQISAMYMKVAQIKFKKQEKFYFLASIDPDDQKFIDESFGVKVETGRNLKKGELGKVVLGYNYRFANKIFKKPIKLGDKVDINDQSFEVIGFYEEIGNPGDDANIYTTPEVMEALYDNIKDKYAFAMLRADRNVNPTKLAEKIQEKLRKHKGQEEGKEDFFVQSFEDAIAVFNTVIGVLNGILILIALISLIVASVNIMNTMYTAILERTKEIGVLKAVGARNRNILFIFVFESAFLGLVGGTIGVFFGYLIASMGGNIAAASGFASLQPAFPLWLIIGCLLFSMGIGAVSGIVPAWQASRLKPVEALRYE